MSKSVACSWSGGKDSCYALQQYLSGSHNLKVLVNMMNENGLISRSHGLPQSILQQQSDAMGVPIIMMPSTWEDYEKNFINILTDIKTRFSVTEMIFGDIDLQEHRDWEEKVCSKAGIIAQLPLWKKDRYQLVKDMIQSGIRTIIVSCNETMGPDLLGKELTLDLVHELQSKQIDPCGENGEFHTVVIESPLFSFPIELPIFSRIKHGNYWFADWNRT